MDSLMRDKIAVSAPRRAWRWTCMALAVGGATLRVSLRGRAAPRDRYDMGTWVGGSPITPLGVYGMPLVASVATATFVNPKP